MKISLIGSEGRVFFTADSNKLDTGKWMDGRLTLPEATMFISWSSEYTACRHCV